MGKVRVFYKPDGKVTVRTPVLKSKRSNETEQEWLIRVFELRDGIDPKTRKVIPHRLKGLPFDDVDDSELPVRIDATRGKWRGTKGEGIHIDHSVVLPWEVIVSKQAELDAELAKEEPDMVTLIRLNREIEKIKAAQTAVQS